MEKIIYGAFDGARRVVRCIGRPSPRENQVLQLFGRGYEADEIAGVLEIGCGTARTYLNSLRSIVRVKICLSSEASPWDGSEGLYRSMCRSIVRL